MLDSCVILLADGKVLQILLSPPLKTMAVHKTKATDTMQVLWVLFPGQVLTLIEDGAQHMVLFEPLLVLLQMLDLRLRCLACEWHGPPSLPQAAHAHCQASILQLQSHASLVSKHGCNLPRKHSTNCEKHKSIHWSQFKVTRRWTAGSYGCHSSNHVKVIHAGALVHNVRPEGMVCKRTPSVSCSHEAQQP